ncbi:MAG: HD domain-containing protein [Spirochaetota bacterium]|nr:MAG: HD domain-containing protein [Spirochaetota bacterium]
MKVPSYVFDIAEKLHKNGHEAWIVGGSIRDLIIGRPAYDYDIATDAHPQDVMTVFKKAIPTGIKHGTVTILTKGHKVEVTTFRADGKYTDGRRPDWVSYASTIQEDISRRDFTINGIAYNPITDKIVDPYDGQDDIQNRIIRTIGDPIERFKEDGLRPFRACRFASQLTFTIEEKTYQAITRCLDITREISMERIRDEFLKIIQSPRPSIGIDLMRKSGLLELILPELLTGFGIKQNRYHRYDIYYHNLYSLDAAPQENYQVRLAALFHDIGKYHAKRDVEESGNRTRSVFYNHEIIGAAVTKRIMRRLKFSNNDIKAVTHLIRNHMFHYTRQWTDGAVRRFIRKVGLENSEALFELRKADRIGNGLKQGDSNSVRALKKRIEKVIEEENAITVKDLAVNGHDIMSTFSLNPGPLIGKILSNLLEVILDDPDKNTKKNLLAIAKEIVVKEDVEA